MLLGALLSMLSAFSFSINNIMARRGMVRASARQGTFVSVLIGVPLFVLAALVSGQLMRVDELSVRAYLFLAAAGVLHFGVGRRCNYRAIGAIGSARSQPIQSMNLPYSVLIAFLFLGERITLQMAGGIGLMMAGLMIALERRPASPSGAPPLRPAEGYLFAILAALCYGTSPILIRAALEGTPGVSVLGGAVAYFAAGLYVLAGAARRRDREVLRGMDLAGVRLFFGAGFFVFLAQMLRFIALSIAPVAIVSPLQRMTALFTLLLAGTVNRDLEWITPKVVIGVLVSVVGTLVLVFS